MCFLPEGIAKLQVRCQGTPRIRRLIVRAIPELMLCGYPGGPHVKGYGKYDSDFLRKDVLANLNVIVGAAGGPIIPVKTPTGETVDLWQQMGRRRLQEQGLPHIVKPGVPVTSDVAFDWWTKTWGFALPNYSGIVADEFGLGGGGYTYSAYIDAVRRMAAAPEFKDRALYAWCSGAHMAEGQSKEFVQTVLAAGYRIALEEYLVEHPTEEAGHERLHHHLRTKMERAIANFPGLVEELVLVLGFMSAQPESANVYPNVDYKVWLDMQMRYVATAPEFFGLYGLMWYKLSYAEEEAVRWAGRLYRHYAIEGNTELLSKAYGYTYLLEHLQNPDFDDGLNGWTASEAESGAIRVGNLKILGRLQGRYHGYHKGHNFLLTRRCASGPNTVSQNIRGLKPGKLYSMKMLTTDHSELLQTVESRRDADVRVAIDDVAMVAAKSFCSKIRSSETVAASRPVFNYHRLVFRATGTTAKLTISDWTSSDAPGGPVGQQIMYNFVEVQPFLED